MTTDDEGADYLWKRRDVLFHRAQLSSLYHRSRERFFDVADRTSKFATLLSGSAALASITDDGVRVWLLVAVAITSALSLAFAFAERARRHADLATKWTLLEADMERAGEREFTDEMLNDWSARRAEIEATEPPHSRALVKMIQNRIATASGKARHPMTKTECVMGWLGI